VEREGPPHFIVTYHCYQDPYYLLLSKNQKRSKRRETTMANKYYTYVRTIARRQKEEIGEQTTNPNS
jgi:hypothetical protein